MANSLRDLLVRATLLLAWLAPAAAAQHVAQAPAAPTSPWEFSGAAYYTDPPGSVGRVTTILYGQRGPLHLELRYNYEDLDTASFFVGRTFATGEELALEITPMLGAVIGATDAVAPGLEIDLGWKRLAWYTEAEYLFDVEDAADDYFYSWSTLTYGVTDWLGAGLVAERTKLVDTDFEVQAGLALEFTFDKVELSVYTYNLGTNDAYTVLSLGLSL